MSNLFKGWNKENLAVAALARKNMDFSVCNKFYCLGNQEIERNFPFNFISKEDNIASGVLKLDKDFSKASLNTSQSLSVSKWSKLKESVLTKTGQIHRRRKFVISQGLLNWIKEFSPDVLYTQLSSFELIEFAEKLQSRLEKPLIIHMMDDWPSTITNLQSGIFRFYWDYRINKSFRHLISKARLLMSISDAMSEAYMARYGKKFVPFHNPIEIERWLPYAKKDWQVNGIFRIIYTGRIGTANNKSLFFIADAINSMNQSGVRIEFNIYSPDFETNDAEKMMKYKGIQIFKSVAYSAMPELLANSDLLILSLDFDTEGLKFAQYSMPTKASEYMISGTPVLVFASMQTALAKYASSEGWAYVVSDYSAIALTDAIDKLMKDKSLRIRISEKAKITAIKNENASTVRERFRESFIFSS